MSVSSDDGVEEVMRRLEVEDGEENGGVSDGYPDRPGEPDCIYFLRTGFCGYGINCRFNHPSHGGQVDGVKNTIELPERVGQPDCEYYLKTGTCKYGFVCKYHHPKDKQPDKAVMNLMGLPMRQDAKPCPYYMRTGSCNYGAACKFHHPQPALGGKVLPVVEPVYGSGGSTVVHSSGMTSGVELSPAPYFGTSLQLQQSYMPLYLSPSQGYNTYMGGVSHLPVANVLASSSTNGQLSVSHLPERPEQLECRYFMKYGSCKYGPGCKYHHPRERKLSQLASCSIGPLGLPLRPGLPVCSHYARYGLCKYGPTCRFDHPLDGYRYASYSLSVPPPATTYPRMLVAPPLQVQLTNPKASKLGDLASHHNNQIAETRGVGDLSEPSSEAISNGSD